MNIWLISLEGIIKMIRGIGGALRGDSLPGTPPLEKKCVRFLALRGASLLDIKLGGK